VSVSAKEVIDEVLFKLNQNVKKPLALTRSKVLGEINNFLVDMTENTPVFVAKSTSALVFATGVATYTLPTSLYEIRSLTDYNGEDIYPTTVDQLMNFSSTWQTEVGDPRWYVLDFDAPRSIRFFRKPSADWNLKPVTLVYTTYRADIVNESSLLPAPLTYSKTIAVNYCLSQLYKFQMEVQNEALGEKYWQDYLIARNKWDKKSTSPPKRLIMGVAGTVVPERRGPRLPSNYPLVTDLW
jgi:hypothetical protein